MNKVWQDQAWEDFEYWTSQDRKTLKRILQLLQDIERNGNIGIGKPEPLRGNWSGFLSRRIDDCKRFVYSVRDCQIEISQFGSHNRYK